MPMSIAALSRFTVPLASDQSASSQGMLMPKLSYRFRVMFENFGVSGSTTEMTKQVADAARPVPTFNAIVVEVYNSTIQLAGRPKWGAIAVTLRDDVTGAVSKLVGEQNQKQFDFFEQSSAASGGDYKFTMRIEILDGGNGAEIPNVLETWECYGCWLVSSTYSALKYSEQNPATIVLSIQPDNCVQTGPSAGLGTQGFKQTRSTNITGGGGQIGSQ
jgi:hypothetical protein